MGLWGCHRVGALARTRPAPLTVNATRPIKCTEGGVLGRLCGSWFGSSLLLSQAFQKPWTLFPSPQPQPPQASESKYVVERMRGWKSGDRPHPHTSAHFLVGSSPDSSEGHFAQLCSKAAGLDLDNLEGSGSLEEWAQAPPPRWVISLWSTGFPAGSVAQPRSPPRMGVKACGGRALLALWPQRPSTWHICTALWSSPASEDILSPSAMPSSPEDRTCCGAAPSAPCPLRGPSPATRGWQPGSGH